MKHLLLLALAVTLSVGVAYAQDGKGDGVLEEVTKAVVDVITGENESNSSQDASAGDSGNENALNQIDKNLEKHGGEHKGLENARAAVSKSKGNGKGKDKNKKHDEADEAEEGVVEQIADAVEEELEEAVEEIKDAAEEQVGEAAADESVEAAGKGKNHAQGKGKGKGKKK